MSSSNSLETVSETKEGDTVDFQKTNGDGSGDPLSKAGAGQEGPAERNQKLDAPPNLSALDLARAVAAKFFDLLYRQRQERKNGLSNSGRFPKLKNREWESIRSTLTGPVSKTDAVNSLMQKASRLRATEEETEGLRRALEKIFEKKTSESASLLLLNCLLQQALVKPNKTSRRPAETLRSASKRRL